MEHLVRDKQDSLGVQLPDVGSPAGFLHGLQKLSQPLPGSAGLQGILCFQVADAGPCPDKPCRGLVMLGTCLIHLPLF